MRIISRRLMAAFVALSAIALIGVGCHEEEPRIPDGEGETVTLCFDLVTTDQDNNTIMVIPVSSFMGGELEETEVFVDLYLYTVTAWVPSGSFNTDGTIKVGTTIGIIDIQPIAPNVDPWLGEIPTGGKITDQPVKVGM